MPCLHVRLIRIMLISPSIAMFGRTAKMKLGDIFKEGSEARKRFAQFYAVAAILVILAVLLLLALATRG